MNTERLRGWRAAVAVGLVLLLAGLGLSWWALQSANKARDGLLEQAKQEAVAVCESGNTFRTGDKELWTEVLSLSAPPKTAKQQATVDTFKAFLAKHDALRDCSKP